MKNELLRHTLSTIKHRLEIAIYELENDFGDFHAGKQVRTPLELLYHINDLLQLKCYKLIDANQHHILPKSDDFNSELVRFKTIIKNLDNVFAHQSISINHQKTLLQGPLSDIFTHIGQLLLLRRLYGVPTLSGNYASINLETGIN